MPPTGWAFWGAALFMARNQEHGSKKSGGARVKQLTLAD